FAGGVGAWTAPLASAFFKGGNLEKVWPMDLWVSEGFTFLSLHHSPHFIAGTALIVLSVAFLARSFERQSTRDAVRAGVSMLALYSFHPFHVLSLGLTTLAFLLLAWIIRRPDFWKIFGRFTLAW